ncbi:EF-hand domain-containing protein [Oleisolibacter albus]|uniref:EF-hand domain-containing protein n=1 Tax=Oleisolibacter albus TaxID=2171757 RepID=UPI00139065D4|nr:EF-hand domain-containing protein [Oleisolibacter albus]
MMVRPLILAALSTLVLASAAHAQAEGPRRQGPGAQAMWEKMDTNKDGVVDEAEFKAARAEMFKRMDKDGDGKISKADFPAAMDQARTQRHAEMQNRMFDQLDTNKDGFVTADEFAAGAGKGFERFDRNDDGKLTPEDRPQGKRN